jgi:hypothetical protein
MVLLHKYTVFHVGAVHAIRNGLEKSRILINTMTPYTGNVTFSTECFLWMHDGLRSVLPVIKGFSLHSSPSLECLNP